MSDHAATIIEQIDQRLEALSDRIALRYKEENSWHEISRASLREQIQGVARGLLSFGVKEADRVGIISNNCPAWTIADMAIMKIRAISVPIHTTNSDRELEYIIKESQMRILFVGDDTQYQKARAFQEKYGQIEKIIVFDSKTKLSSDALALADCLKMEPAPEYDVEIAARRSRIQADDIATIIYTSGTTGEPKGVMISQSNIYHSLIAHQTRLGWHQDDTILSFLPLSHVLERMMVYFALAIGMGVNYCANPLKVINYLSVVNPTIMASVPRILDLIYSNVQRQLAQSKKHKQAIFHWAIAIGDKVSRLANEEKNVPLLLQLQHRLADRLVLKKLRRITGEKMRMLCCAGAPLPEKIHRFFNACGVFIIYGYGLTEAFATVSCFKLSHNVHGTVGYPLDCLEVKIAENGEILFKGPTIMVGYYNKPKETAAAFDNGWLKTGDGGYLRDDGNIVLTDRLKDLMRTPAGLYVAPQMLESIFCKDTYIAQIVVIGDGRNYLTALIVPDFSQLNVYATNAGLDTSDSAKLLQEPKILDLYTARIEELNKDLALHEKIKRFTLLPQEFSQDKGELTITLKARRKVINEHYRDIIEAMYR